MPNDTSTAAVWILGATGRTGRAVASRLTAAGIDVGLVGRNATTLSALAFGLPGPADVIVAASLAAAAEEIALRRPAVVVNTVGPFTETAPLIARACLPSSHYLDIANELPSALALFEFGGEALAAGRTFVSGAGFGVLATESVVARLCAGRPTPSRVRVDAYGSSALEEGTLGEALAATITQGLTEGGRRYVDGAPVRTRGAGKLHRLTLPDGTTAVTAELASGDLHAAWRTSGAPSVVATSGLAPTAPVVRAILPVAAALMTIGPLRRVLTRRLAGIPLKPTARPREHSWGHAEITWPDGTTRQGWLRTGDAMEFTAVAVAAAATRLLAGTGAPGVHHPGAAFGPDLATDAGGELTVE